MKRGHPAMKNKKAFTILLTSQIIFGIFLFAWFLFMEFSVMLFDAPGSEKNPTVLTLFFTILAYPAGLLAGVITSWILYTRRKYTLAYVFNCIPLLWVIPIIGFVAYANLS